jgi:hypothetical protein
MGLLYLFTCNTVSLPSGWLSVAALNTQVWPLSGHVCRVGNIGFYECYIYLVHSLRFLAVRDHCPPATPLNVSAHRIFPVLLLPNRTSHVDAACAHRRWSILATWSPHFYLTLWATATMSFHVGSLPYFSIRHSVAPHNMQYSPFYLPLTHFKIQRPLYVSESNVSCWALNIHTVVS